MRLETPAEVRRAFPLVTAMFKIRELLYARLTRAFPSACNVVDDFEAPKHVTAVESLKRVIMGAMPEPPDLDVDVSVEMDDEDPGAANVTISVPVERRAYWIDKKI